METTFRRLKWQYLPNALERTRGNWGTTITQARNEIADDTVGRRIDDLFLQRFQVLIVRLISVIPSRPKGAQGQRGHIRG